MTPEPVSTLDGALVRVSALEFEAPAFFVNHGPMACEALVTLGVEVSLEGWVQAFESMMASAPQPVAPPWGAEFDWQGALGDSALLPEWLGYFDRAIADEGWVSVVDRWVPRFMPGLAAALFHGVIRTSHAVRAIDSTDTPARRAELARALASWATWIRSGPAPEGPAPADDAHNGAARAAARAARHYVGDPSIFTLHTITGAMAVDLLTAHLSEADASAAVRQLAAEQHALFRTGDPFAGGEPRPWDSGTESAASRSHDAHQVKLVEACRRGHRSTGDPVFVEAARVATG